MQSSNDHLSMLNFILFLSFKQHFVDCMCFLIVNYGTKNNVNLENASDALPERKATLVDERGPSLVGFLQNLSEGLAQPRSDKFTA